jgi:cell division protein FtsB
MLKVTGVVLLVVTAILQYKAWFGDVGYLSNQQLREDIAEQRQRTEVLTHRNRILTAEVLALQRDNEAVEASARRNLGMTRQGETFYVFTSKEP